jgi:RNA polymerase sigma-70 factor (ECF subfamily)
MELLTAARTGDESAFTQLVDPHRRELHAHCYRMLGSVHDAEDAVQDALLRAWRGVSGFEGRSSFRAWLYRIATNTCLRLIEKRPVRVLPVGFEPSAEVGAAPLTERVWLEPYPGPESGYQQRESVELAFVAALQLLPARQRAVLVLREVLGFSAKEVADALDTTVPAVNSALQRARKAVDTQVPDRSQQATLRLLGDDELRDVVDRYVTAWQAGDVTTIVAMLAEDAKYSMPPDHVWYAGHAAIEKFLRVGPFGGGRRWRFHRADTNGQVAFATYCWDGTAFQADGVDVLTLRRHEIAEVTAFRTPDLFPVFGLPMTLPD